MKNLVIGNTSQLSEYFPKDYVKISSRDIDYNFIESENWNRIFLCFGESRKFLEDTTIYDEVNFYYTLDVINKVKEKSKNVIVYSTCELWNQNDGKIDLSMNFNFYSTPYLQSKFRLSKFLLNNKSKYSNVFLIFPFNFNSIKRTEEFVFGKIFDSILNKKKIEIGDTYFYRDMIHPKYVVERSIKCNSDEIVGSGRLTFVNDFIRELYDMFDIHYDEYVSENLNNKIYNEYEKKKEYYLNSNKCLYSYNQLLKDTIEELKNDLEC